MYSPVCRWPLCWRNVLFFSGSLSLFTSDQVGPITAGALLMRAQRGRNSSKPEVKQSVHSVEPSVVPGSAWCRLGLPSKSSTVSLTSQFSAVHRRCLLCYQFSVTTPNNIPNTSLMLVIISSVQCSSSGAVLLSWHHLLVARATLPPAAGGRYYRANAIKHYRIFNLSSSSVTSLSFRSFVALPV